MFLPSKDHAEMSAEEKSTNLTRLYPLWGWLCLNCADLAVCALLLRDMPLGLGLRSICVKC